MDLAKSYLLVQSIKAIDFTPDHLYLREFWPVPIVSIFYPSPGEKCVLDLEIITGLKILGRGQLGGR